MNIYGCLEAIKAGQKIIEKNRDLVEKMKQTEILNKKLSLMETKLIIEGKEIKLSEETVRELKEKLLKKTTYEDVAESLFCERNTYYTKGDGRIGKYSASGNTCMLPNNCTSEKQAQKLLAINKLLNTAKYLNGDWKPDFKDQREAKYILKTEASGLPFIDFWYSVNGSPAYFKSNELALQALEILGEETIKLALSTDW